MSIFDTYDKAQSGFSAKLKKLVAESFPYLILFLNIIFLVISRLFSGSINTVFDGDFWVNLMLNCASSMICYACFLMYSDVNTRKTHISYTDNVSAWQTLSAKIRSRDNFNDFILYCKERENVEREEIREAMISNHTRISLKEFKDRYSKLTNEELKDLVKQGHLTRREVLYIKKARGNIYVKPIKPLLILSGVKLSQLNDAGRADEPSSFKSIMGRPVSMFISSALTVSMNFIYVGISDAAVLFNMLCSVMLIVVSAFLGYSKGVSNVSKRNDVIKVRIMFLDKYEKVLLERDEKRSA